MGASPEGPHLAPHWFVSMNVEEEKEEREGKKKKRGGVTACSAAPAHPRGTPPFARGAHNIQAGKECFCELL